MRRAVWNPTEETDETLEAVMWGRDPRFRSHHSRIIADKELNRRKAQS